MLHTRAELESFHQLLKHNFAYSLIPGLRIGRGFADVGYEEYSVLTGNQAISMNTGKTIALDEFYQNYYFPILTADQIVKELYSRGWDVMNVSFHDQRMWQINIDKAPQTLSAENQSLLGVFLNLLLQVLEGKADV